MIGKKALQFRRAQHKDVEFMGKMMIGYIEATSDYTLDSQLARMYMDRVFTRSRNPPLYWIGSIGDTDISCHFTQRILDMRRGCEFICLGAGYVDPAFRNRNFISTCYNHTASLAKSVEATGFMHLVWENNPVVRKYKERGGVEDSEVKLYEICPWDDQLNLDTHSQFFDNWTITQRKQLMNPINSSEYPTVTLTLLEKGQQGLSQLMDFMKNLPLKKLDSVFYSDKPGRTDIESFLRRYCEVPSGSYFIICDSSSTPLGLICANIYWGEYIGDGVIIIDDLLLSIDVSEEKAKITASINIALFDLMETHCFSSITWALTDKGEFNILKVLEDQSFLKNDDMIMHFPLSAFE